MTYWSSNPFSAISPHSNVSEYKAKAQSGAPSKAPSKAKADELVWPKLEKKKKKTHRGGKKRRRTPTPVKDKSRPKKKRGRKSSPTQRIPSPKPMIVRSRVDAKEVRSSDQLAQSIYI